MFLTLGKALENFVGGIAPRLRAWQYAVYPTSTQNGNCITFVITGKQRLVARSNKNPRGKVTSYCNLFFGHSFVLEMRFLLLGLRHAEQGVRSQQ